MKVFHRGILAPQGPKEGCKGRNAPCRVAGAAHLHKNLQYSVGVSGIGCRSYLTPTLALNSFRSRTESCFQSAKILREFSRSFSANSSFEKPRDDRITCLRDFERCIETLEIVGGGGTDFTPAFRRIDRLIERGDFRDLRCALIFTDGRGIFPTAAPAYDVVVVGIRGHFDGIDVPHWAGKLLLDMEDGGGDGA